MTARPTPHATNPHPRRGVAGFSLVASLLLVVSMTPACSSDDADGASASSGEDLRRGRPGERDTGSDAPVASDRPGDPGAQPDRSGSDGPALDSETPDTSAPDTGRPDAGPGSDRGRPDSAPPRPDSPDPCAGLPTCLLIGSACEGDTLVSCARNSDGCLVESRTNCSPGGGQCDESGAEALCREPLPGESCDSAIRAEPGTLDFDTSDRVSGWDSYFGCGVSGGWGGDVLLVTSVPAGQTLRVTVSSSDIDVQAVIAEACDEIERWPVDCSDTDRSDPETVETVNDTGAAHDFFIVADGYNFDDFGPLRVAITVE